MREQTPLESFMGFMNLPKNSQNSEFSKQNDEFAVQDFIISDESELKQCVEAFGEPLNLLTTKEF